jgi:pyruvate dehydrogenase (quinone)
MGHRQHGQLQHPGDRDPRHLGRRAPLELAVAGDVQATVAALLPMVAAKPGDAFLRKHVAKTERFAETLQHYVTKGPGIKPIRPEYLAAVLSELADDDAVFFADTGTACIWAARHITYGAQRRQFGRFRSGFDQWHRHRPAAQSRRFSGTWRGAGAVLSVGLPTVGVA